MGLDLALAEFVSVARRAGLVLSPVEAIDAQRAAIAVGLGARDDLRAALRSVMARDRPSAERFDRVFDAFFGVQGAQQGNLFDRLRSAGFSEPELDALKELLDAFAATHDGATDFAAVVAGGGALESLLQAAGRSAGVDRMQNPMQVGFFTQRVLEAAGAPRMQAGLGALRERLRDALGARGETLADALGAQLDSFRRAARDHVRAELDRRTATARDDLRRARFESQPIRQMDPAEREQIEREVRRMAQKLRGALQVRRKRERRGTLDVRRTLRAAHRTGGLPFVPAVRRRRRDRPRIVVLCDISDSVRFASRFLLLFVYSIQEVFDRTRTFVFVSDLGETTRLFADHPIERAIQLAHGGSVISVAANSNYGRALGQFAREHLGAVDRRTTVVIVGDGRNNYNDADVPALQAIRRRARRVLWLNPEAPGAWGFGDSVMHLYAPVCDEVLPVHDLLSLRVATERLVVR